MLLCGIEVPSLSLEIGRIEKLAGLPPGPAGLPGDRRALEGHLERARIVTLVTCLACKEPEGLALAEPETEPP